MKKEILDLFNTLELYILGEHNHETDSIQQEEDQFLLSEITKVKNKILKQKYRVRTTVTKTYEKENIDFLTTKYTIQKNGGVLGWYNVSPPTNDRVRAYEICDELNEEYLN